MTAESLESELNIPQSLKEIIEDSDDEIPLRFDNPNELMDIFTTFEEQNLFLIKRCQDSEQQLEEKKGQEKQFKSEFSMQIGILKGNENTNMSRIEKTNQEKDALIGISEDTEGKSLDPYTQARLEIEI